MKTQLNIKLEQLNNQMILMGSLIECAIEQAVTALFQGEIIYAESASDFDAQINRKEKEIENLCLRLLLQQQPLATDLRVVSSALKMITDMERIGDHACDICEITLRLSPKNHIEKIHHIKRMAKIAVGMVQTAIDAFVGQDQETAWKVIETDDQVDSLFTNVREELVRILQEDKKEAEFAVDLLMIAKYFERIGDHAVNLAEWVLFSITGTRQNKKTEEKHGIYRRS